MSLECLFSAIATKVPSRDCGGTEWARDKSGTGRQLARDFRAEHSDIEKPG
jgi:hypothetical protein